MSDAGQLVAQIRSDLTPLERKIVGHPCLAAIEEGLITRDLFKFLTGQQYHIIGSDLAVLPCLSRDMGRCPAAIFSCV